MPNTLHLLNEMSCFKTVSGCLHHGGNSIMIRDCSVVHMLEWYVSFVKDTRSIVPGFQVTFDAKNLLDVMTSDQVWGGSLGVRGEASSPPPSG